MRENASQPDTIISGNLKPVITRLAVPSIISQVLFLFPTIYDAFWLGRIGPEAQSAAGLATAIRIAMISVLMALSGGTGAVVTRFLGAKDQKRADAATLHGVLLMIFSSGTLGIIGILFTGNLMKLAGADTEMLPYAIRYGRILFGGLIAMELVPSLGGVFTTAGVPSMRLSMMAWVVGVLVIAQPLFISWWGLEGAVLALVSAHAAGMFWGLWKLIQGNYAVRITLKDFHLDPSMAWRILRVTGPAILQRGVPNFGMVILMRFIASFGSQTLAAWVIVQRLSSFSLLLAQGISSLSGAMVGQNLGARQPERAKHAVRVITRMVLWISAGILALFAVCAPQLMRIFSNDAPTIQIGVNILRIIAIGYLGQAVSWVFDSALVGAGDTVSPMLIYGGMWSLQLLLAYTLSHILNYGTIGIWIALDIGWCIQTLLLQRKFRKGLWVNKTI